MIPRRGPERAALAAGLAAALLAAPAPAAERQLLWGDTHVHSSYSPDAFAFGNRSADPDTAYRFARGLPVLHPYHRDRVQIGVPLDFLVVADHAELTGVPLKLLEGDPLLPQTETAARWAALLRGGEIRRFIEGDFGAALLHNRPIPDFETEAIRSAVWDELVAAAERHHEPGRFTTLIGWEWTSSPGANLHRVVFTNAGGDVARRFLPFSSFDSDQPERLWAWLEETSRRTGADFVAIPHNSNLGVGRMFQAVEANGEPMGADTARTRARWEPVIEVTQVKGDSETHPRFSPNDEFADFETFRARFIIDPEGGSDAVPEPTRADFARTALLRGLEIEARSGENPYAFGMIGSTDSHTGLSSSDERDFHGKFALDSVPENRFQVLASGFKGTDMGAAGLAAVWAEANTREAIFAAFRRREVYASSGPRIHLRFFGGWNFEAADAASPKLAEIGYAGGVPMGGELGPPTSGAAPRFLVRAWKDPRAANLDRIQIVKGWLGSDGTAQERVHDVALSDGRRPGPDGRVPPVGSSVDRSRASYSNSIGDAELGALWIDPDFDPTRSAFYYVRVLEIPTPRHTLYDAVALGREPPPGHPETIQERVYSSPIWYHPD